MNARLVVFMLLTVGALAPSVAISDPGRPALKLLISTLGKPAKEDVVHALVDRPGSGSGSDGLLLVASLVDAGGAPAQRGLARLIERADETVATAACRGLAALGIRCQAAADRAVDATASRDVSLRTAGCEALGQIGDGIAAAVLIGCLSDPEEVVRTAALASLQHLSGIKLPLVIVRWKWWLASELPRSNSALLAALDGLAAPRPAQRDEAEQIVLRTGWIDVEQTIRTTTACMRSRDRDLEVRACRIVAKLRLGDMSDELPSLLIFTESSDTWKVGVDSAKAIGLPLEGTRLSRLVQKAAPAPADPDRVLSGR